MSIDENKEIKTAPEAIRRAFEFFEEFMTEGSYKLPLLEGVKYEDPNWTIVIGFDLGSNRESLGVLGMGEKISPRRLARTFLISEADGSLIEMS